MALHEEDNPAMAGDAEIMTQVREHVVTLRLRLQTDQDEPEGWDWMALLDLNGVTERVVVCGSSPDGPAFLVDEYGELADPGALSSELAAAQANAGTGEGWGDYGYSPVPAEGFTPYEPAREHVLTAGQCFVMRLEGDTLATETLVAGDSVWLHDLSGSGFWRVYAARTASGRCFTLSST